MAHGQVTNPEPTAVVPAPFRTPDRSWLFLIVTADRVSKRWQLAPDTNNFILIPYSNDTIFINSGYSSRHCRIPDSSLRVRIAPRMNQSINHEITSSNTIISTDNIVEVEQTSSRLEKSSSTTWHARSPVLEVLPLVPSLLAGLESVNRTIFLMVHICISRMRGKVLPGQQLS
jgi:hypothetical protein